MGQKYLGNYFLFLFTEDHISSLECSIANQDYSSRPAMLLVTPYDLNGTAWSSKVPTFTILARLMHLSRKALDFAEESLLKNGTVQNFKVINFIYN